MVHFLSLQSQVAYGHVGNSAAVFALQRLGHEVWPVPTVLYSNHAGYADFGGQAVAPAVVADIVGGIERRGVFAACDAVLSGYVGDAATGMAILDAVARVRRANPHAAFCCDPVMGDSSTHGGKDGAVYVAADIVAFMAQQAVPQADIITPNLFELAILTGLDPARVHKVPLPTLIGAARRLFAPGRPTHTILLTSLDYPGMAAASTGAAVITRDAAWQVVTPVLPFDAPPHGTGDLLAALFCAVLLSAGDCAVALGEAVSAVYAVLESTSAQGADELALVSAQGAFVAPERIFVAESIGQVA